jgi:hypothetical protein
MVLAMNKNSTKDELIDKIVRLMQTDEAADAPADAVKWAKNIFRARAAQKKKSLVRKVLAVLQVDLSGGQAAFGERSAASQTRQMFFQAGENAIDLRIAKTESGLNLQGQVLGEGFEKCAVKLGKFETTANKLGEFSFAGIPSGKYDLTLLTADREITAANLELN